VKLSHVWTGRCAATYDLFPRTGVHDGVHYALGYCFSGIAMGPYLATKAARRIMGAPDSDSFFAREPFPRAPWYARSPALLSALMRYHEWADRPAARPRA
jgi:glycine/D-amino acid oxidase-like deaminating enzyme